MPVDLVVGLLHRCSRVNCSSGLHGKFLTCPDSPYSHRTTLLRVPEVIGSTACCVAPRCTIASPTEKLASFLSPVVGSTKYRLEPVKASPGRFMFMLNVSADRSLCCRICVSLLGCYWIVKAKLSESSEAVMYSGTSSRPEGRIYLSTSSL